MNKLTRLITFIFLSILTIIGYGVLLEVLPFSEEVASFLKEPLYTIFLFTFFPGVLIFLLYRLYKRIYRKTGTDSKNIAKNENLTRPDKSNKRFSENKVLLTALTIVLIALAFLYGQSRALDQQKKLSEKNNGQVEGTNAQVTAPPTITSTPTTKPVQKTAVKPTVIPTIDPNPIVNCNISANCGGGSVQMRKDECSNSTCCQVGNIWKLYPSRNACNQAQEQYSAQETEALRRELNAKYNFDSNDTYVPYSVTRSPTITFAPVPTVKKESDYDVCVSAVQHEYNLKVIYINESTGTGQRELEKLNQWKAQQIEERCGWKPR